MTQKVGTGWKGTDKWIGNNGKTAKGQAHIKHLCPYEAKFYGTMLFGMKILAATWYLFNILTCYLDNTIIQSII